MKRTDEEQKSIERIIKEGVYCLQNEIVENMLQQEVFQWEDIHNFYYTPDEMLDDEGPDNQEPHEIFQWFCISNWLAEMLKEIKYPVLINDYGNWMGRISYGQALDMDSVWDDVVKQIEKNYQEAIK